MDYYFHEPEFKRVKLSKNKKFYFVDKKGKFIRQTSGNKEIEDTNFHILIDSKTKYKNNE